MWANAVINDSNLTMLMRGFDQKTGVDLVVSPSVPTRSGQQATAYGGTPTEVHRYPISIEWPLQGEPILAAKDAAAPLLQAAETFP